MDPLGIYQKNERSASGFYSAPMLQRLDSPDCWQMLLTMSVHIPSLGDPFTNTSRFNHQLNGRNGLKSWQWVFLIEGVICVGLSFPLHFILLSFPETTPALNERGQFNHVRQIHLSWKF